MAIDKKGVKAISVGRLLGKRLANSIKIPPYQRPYSWKPETALQLFHDIDHARRDAERGDIAYVLGAIILHKADGKLNVVDGQQRLLTLKMILKILDPRDAGDFLSSDGNTPVSLVWKVLRERVAHIQAGERREIRVFILRKCQLVRIVTDDEDEAFRVFDSQNYRGKSLAPHDLLKAHHLREMRGESDAMKTAIVETWESVDDGKLDRLFSRFLYRIARWSRGMSAPGFTTHDIGMFKGVSSRSDMSPSARYHHAAQTMVPMLKAWGGASGIDDRDLGRSQFQLDAPLLAGRHFFEMVTFMLDELTKLGEEAFDGGYLEFNALQSRYRYVAELYLAALLYYTNKFGRDDSEWNVLRKKLFSWAYSLRVNLLRVQFLSVDNLARGTDDEPTAFVLFRNTMDGRVVHQLPTGNTPYSDEHEKALVAFINQ